MGVHNYMLYELKVGSCHQETGHPGPFPHYAALLFLKGINFVTSICAAHQRQLHQSPVQPHRLLVPY